MEMSYPCGGNRVDVESNNEAYGRTGMLTKGEGLSRGKEHH